MTIITDGILRIRMHRGWGHGLRPGTNSDLNCIACKREGGAHLS